MKSTIKGAAKRLVISLLLACGLGGCAYYGPPYAPYDSSYPYYSYGPGYAYPPVSLDLGFTYFDHGSRHHGGHGWGHHGGRGHHGFHHGGGGHHGFHHGGGRHHRGSGHGRR
jgi:hypothetical protein